MKRPAHRPEYPAATGFSVVKRRMVSRAIFDGVLPDDWYPAEYQDMVRLAKGKKLEADEVAAEILGAGHSVESIRLARRRRPMDAKTWRQLKAVYKAALGKRDKT